MLSISNIFCSDESGNERLRYGHRANGQETEAIPRPVVVWAVTQACNLRCAHCYASATAHSSPEELTFGEGVRLLNDLRAFGVPAILFSGGEPLSNSDTPELIGYAHSIGLSPTLSTNGLLIDGPMAKRLARLGLKYAGISLDGRAERHDKLRGQQGAFMGALAAIDRCRQEGIKVGLRFTVHALNVADLDEIFNICLEHGIERLCIYHLAYSGRGGKMQKVDLSHEETRGVLDHIIHRTRAIHQSGQKLEVLTVGNHADAAYALLTLERENSALTSAAWKRLRATGGNRSGCNIASIGPKGDVHYDQFSWHYNCGNVREERFSRIWTGAFDPRLAILRDRAAHLPARCRECRFLDVCNGNLRSRAEAASGDWLGVDPACYLRQDERTPAAIH